MLFRSKSSKLDKMETCRVRSLLREALDSAVAAEVTFGRNREAAALWLTPEVRFLVKLGFAAGAVKEDFV
jgi:hypothetical protein